MEFIAYIIHVLALITIFGIITISFNIAVGWTGLINLAHFAFAGVGAYTWAVLLTKFGMPSVFAFLLALLVTALLAYLLAIMTKNISGDQFVLITLFLGFIIWIVLLNWKSVTRGSLGIPRIPRFEVLKVNFNYLVLSSSILAGVYWCSKRITESSFGRALEAVRDDELAAKILGKNTFNLKAKSLVISSVIAAIGGILLASFVSYINPNTFYVHDLVFILTALIIGGLASLKGSVAGIFLLFAIVESLRFLPIPPEMIGPLRQIIYALLLIIIILYRPRGLFGKIELE